MTTTFELTCLEVVRSLWDYVDHAVPDEQRDAVAEHLRGCSACEGHIDFARALVGRIGTLPMPEPELAALRERVRAALILETMRGGAD